MRLAENAPRFGGAVAAKEQKSNLQEDGVQAPIHVDLDILYPRRGPTETR